MLVRGDDPPEPPAWRVRRGGAVGGLVTVGRLGAVVGLGAVGRLGAVVGLGAVGRLGAVVGLGVVGCLGAVVGLGRSEAWVRWSAWSVLARARRGLPGVFVIG